MKYMIKFQEFREKKAKIGSYMTYMKGTSDSGAGGRGFESHIARKLTSFNFKKLPFRTHTEKHSYKLRKILTIALKKEKK